MKKTAFLKYLFILVLVMTFSQEAFSMREFKDYGSFEERYALHCFPPAAKVKKARVIKFKKSKAEVTLNGSSGAINDLAKGNLRIGVISAIKDATKATQNNIVRFIATFNKKKVDLIVVNGDSGYDIEDIEKVFRFLDEKADMPILVTIGNSEGSGQYNNAFLEIRGKTNNLVNMSLTPILKVKGYTLVALGGYYNRKYTSNSGSCIYRDKHFKQLKTLVKNEKENLIFISHGPPKQKGRSALDRIYTGENVGSEKITKFLKDLKIKAGIFGHILEAGGRGTNLSGSKTIKPKKFSSELMVNAGSASSLPWTMLNKKVSKGMALIFEAKGKSYRYEVIK